MGGKEKMEMLSSVDALTGGDFALILGGFLRCCTPELSSDDAC